MRTPLFNPGDVLKDKDNEREVVLVVLSVDISLNDLKYTVVFVNITENYISTTDFYEETIENIFVKM